MVGLLCMPMCVCVCVCARVRARVCVCVWGVCVGGCVHMYVIRRSLCMHNTHTRHFC